MAASSTPSPHRIGIMISTAGSLLQCSVCKLSYNFPDNVQFGTVAKQFTPYPCSSPILRPGSRVAEIVNARQGTERCLTILRHEGRISGDRHMRQVRAQISHTDHILSTLNFRE